MALRGNLKDFSLPDVFQLVQLSGKTGVLRIVAPDAEGSIWFRDGEVFFAQSNWRRDHLGERLVASQRITPAALARALELQANEPVSGRRLGQILVDEGYITQQVLESFVQEQIQDTIFDLMRWDEGDFDFEVLPEVVHEDIGLSVSVENIVMEGSRRLEEWNRIKKKVPSTEMVFKMATAPGEGTFEISLKPVEWNLLLLVDGTRTVAELAHATRRTDFEVARVIYGLFSAGLLEVASDEEVERLRADAARREDKRAVLEASRAAKDEAQKAEALAIEATLEAEAEARRSVDRAEPGAAEESTAAARPQVPAAGPVEEPEFLASPGAAPTADDMAVFEQMMGAVLAPPGGAPVAQESAVAEAGVTAVTSAGEVEEPTLLVPFTPSAEEFDLGVGAISAADLSEIPAPPVAESYGTAEVPTPSGPYTAPEGFVPTGDYEADLRSLGLGELPPELVQPMPESATEAVGAESGGQQAAVAPQDEETLPTTPREPMSFIEEPGPEALEITTAEAAAEQPIAQTEEIVSAAGEAGDLDDLIRSLGEEPSAEAGVISSGADYGAEDAGTAGVISTDAFLEGFDSDIGLSAGLGDELTALTGGGKARTRPVTTVAKLPEPGEAPMLHRDQMVDRALLERIIEGIENL